MHIKLPDFSLVVLIGASGSGKSTFAARHFLPTEIISSDHCRGLVSDDETDQNATTDAFDLVNTIASKRLARRRLTVIDATSVRPEDRKHLVDLARRYHALPVAIVFDIPEAACVARNQARTDRKIPDQVVRGHVQRLRRSLRGLDREGFRGVHVIHSEAEAADATMSREPLWCDRRGEHGPFDIIGDVHGCREELETLLNRLGYAGPARAHPDGRRAVFVGDLVDRGPDSPGVLRLVMDMVAAGNALAVPGNHDLKLVKKLSGREVKLSHGLAETMAQLEAIPEPERQVFCDEAKNFLDKLVSHLWLDGGKLVVAHAGMKEEMQGRGSGAVRGFALYGETTGETDEYGLPVRLNWAAEYRGRAMVVYGHTPTPVSEWINGTICIDTGCVFGGKLTALRYPERELVEVPAARVYMEPVRPLGVSPGPTGQQAADTMLDIEDVQGKRTIVTRLAGSVRVEPENAAAALEVMSRFAVDPRWLIYLPPTMSPPEVSKRAGLLEHPDEAFGYFSRAGVTMVIVEEKHMGSRAVIVLARDAEAARLRFGVEDGKAGVVFTRTGRSFFNNEELEREIIARISAAATTADIWERLATDWLCLDAELMPWSAKAQALIDTQYRPVGEAGMAGTTAAAQLAAQAAARGVDTGDLAARLATRTANATAYDAAWRHYVRPVSGIADLRLAPFHLLASENAVHTDKPHDWHMALVAELASADTALIMATPHRLVDLGDPEDVAAATSWWESLTSSGGEGMVIKPLDFITRGKKGIIQPAIKCRGPEYLRIIYGPDYTMPEHLERLRERGLGAKRGLALREFALGVEALDRFVKREPLRRVHECVFAVLALESEPVDPRL
ncbi:MAG: polynucleotide kinase-phosphatase [Rhodospirillales bacterium 20-64-7]|nr:MAG: polynucleotide kinase-phosphatase [Rhodospirillales bacterium 20-64-7]